MNHNSESGSRGVLKVSSPSSTQAKVNPSQTAPLGCSGVPSAGIHGFVGKKTEDPQARKLLIAASEFATAAMCRLGQDASGTSKALPHMIDRYVDTVFGLEVHFLFPNLPAEKRDLLVAIMKVRNSISTVLNGASRKGAAEEKAAREQLAADLQRRFLEFRSQIVESGIKEQLDPVQKKVFQDEFFSITLDKRCSTTLFFSTDATEIDRAVASHPPVVTSQLPEVAPQLPNVTLHMAEQNVPRQKKVLLISADSGAQDLVSRALLKAGYDLLMANAGFTGYATAMRERPDLVIVDLSLSLEVSGPDACLDGRGVLRMLSKLPSSRALPFIPLVANGTSETEAQGLASGARACLQKPLDPRQVLDAVQKTWAGHASDTDEAGPSPWTVSASV